MKAQTAGTGYAFADEDCIGFGEFMAAWLTRAALLSVLAIPGVGVMLATQFVDVGKQWVVDKMDDSQASTMNRIGWGTGAGTAGETDTTLFTEASETRATATLSQVTTTITGDTFQAVGTITATGTKTITNAGLFDAATVGNMLIKGDFTGVPLLTSDSIEFTFKLQVDQ